MADFATLAVTSQGGVLHVTLNRPASRNAMSLQMVDELRAVLAEAEASGDVRVIVLRGAGGHFCAGADLQDMAQAQKWPAAPRSTMTRTSPEASACASTAPSSSTICSDIALRTAGRFSVTCRTPPCDDTASVAKPSINGFPWAACPRACR